MDVKINSPFSRDYSGILGLTCFWISNMFSGCEIIEAAGRLLRPSVCDQLQVKATYRL